MSKTFISNAITARLKNEIRESPVFTMTDKSSEAYEAARAKLMENIYFLTLEEKGIDPEHFDKRLELMVEADYCINNFDPEKGEFLHYFNRSLGGKSKNSDRKERREIGNIIAVDSENSDNSSDDVLEYMAYRNFRDEYQYYTDDCVLGYGVKDILDGICRAYYKQQKRTRPLFSAYATGLIFDKLDRRTFMECDVSGLPFFDEELYRAALRRNKYPSQRAIASLFGREENNVSRSYSNFRAAIISELRSDYAA